MEPKVVHLDELPAIPGPGSLTAVVRRGRTGLQGRPDAALASLRRAVELRPEVAEWARDDEDLDSLRDDPEFRALAALP